MACPCLMVVCKLECKDLVRIQNGNINSASCPTMRRNFVWNPAARVPLQPLQYIRLWNSRMHCRLLRLWVGQQLRVSSIVLSRLVRLKIFTSMRFYLSIKDKLVHKRAEPGRWKRKHLYSNTIHLLHSAHEIMIGMRLP